MKPSLAMFRNMKMYMIGTSEARSTAPGAKEFWTFARTREVPAGRFVRAGMSGVVNSDIAELRNLSCGFAGWGSGEFRVSGASPGQHQQSSLFSVSCARPQQCTAVGYYNDNAGGYSAEAVTGW